MSSQIQEKIRKKMPWIFVGIRIPKINFPDLEGKNLDIPTPTRSIVLVAIWAVLFWLISGGVYLSIPDSNGNTPITLGANQDGTPMWWYPSINDAFVIESVISGVVIFLGSIGFLIIYQSTKHMYNIEYARKLVAIGFVMVVFSFGFLQYVVMNQKS